MWFLKCISQVKCAFYKFMRPFMNLNDLLTFKSSLIAYRTVFMNLYISHDLYIPANLYIPVNLHIFCEFTCFPWICMFYQFNTFLIDLLLFSGFVRLLILMCLPNCTLQNTHTEEINSKLSKQIKFRRELGLIAWRS